MNKITKTIILVILVIVLAGGVYYTYKHITNGRTPVKNMGASPGASSSPTICYLNRIKTQAGNDDIVLSIVFNKDKTVEGEFNLLPSEKDQMTGTIAGTWSTVGTSTDRTVMTKHSYSAEGKDGVQDVYFKISPENAQFSFDQGKNYSQSLTRVSCQSVMQ